MPEVSVIIPNYNHAAYLELRIESVLNQTFTDYEVIILDDFSTDNSKEILELYKDHPKVTKVIYNSKNGGSTFKQWTAGIKAAKGKYIWIAESDDFCKPEFLDEVVSIANARPSIGIVYCNSEIIDSAGEVVENKNFYDKSERFKCNFQNNGKEECIDFLYKECTIINVSSAIIRHSILKQIDFLYHSYKLSGDWMLYIQILLISDVYFISKKLNYFRTHSCTVRSRTTRIQNIYESSRILQYLVENKVYKTNHVTERYRTIVDDARRALNYSFSSKSWKIISESFYLYSKVICTIRQIKGSL